MTAANLSRACPCTDAAPARLQALSVSSRGGPRCVRPAQSLALGLPPQAREISALHRYATTPRNRFPDMALDASTDPALPAAARAALVRK